jgi:PAS domain S-box-containing protein
MVSKIATFRLPENLIQEIRSRAEATGRDRTAVVVEALKQAFGMPASEPRPATVEELQQQLNKVEKKITMLTEQLAKVTQKSASESQINQVSPVIKQAIASEHALTIADSFLPGRVFSAQTNANGVVEGRVAHSEAMDANASRFANGQELESEFAQGQQDEAGLEALAAKTDHQARIFDLVLSASPDPICVVDRMGRFTYVNLALAQLFGLQQRNILGKTWQQLDLPPEVIEKEPIDAQREVVFATRRPLTNEISYPTINGIRDYECILSPILGVTGSVEAVICTARDITERNHVERSLRESEANYRHLFEYANDSIFIIDLSTGGILDANQNAARRLGYTRQELLKLTTREIDAPVPEVRHKMISKQLQATGSIIFDHALRRKDGVEIAVEISSRIIEYRDRLVSLSFAREITAPTYLQDGL